jgi:hypothetical protein
MRCPTSTSSTHVVQVWYTAFSHVKTLIVTRFNCASEYTSYIWIFSFPSFGCRTWFRPWRPQGMFKQCFNLQMGLELVAPWFN